MRYALLIYEAADAAKVRHVLGSPSSATCVRRDVVTDGPYDGAAALHGFEVIDVDTLDDAIAAAEQVDATVEIRPLR